MTWLAGVVTGVILVIALAAVIPTQTRDLISHATPARSYADEISRVVSRAGAACFPLSVSDA